MSTVNMIEIHVDGKPVEVPQGSMVMHATNKLGTSSSFLLSQETEHRSELPDVFS